MVTARRRHSRRGTTLRYGAAALVLVLAGCGRGGGAGESDAKPPGSAPSASAADTGTPVSSAPRATPAPETSDGAVSAVLEVYRLMSAEQEAAYRAGSSAGTDLGRYTTPAAASETGTELARMRKQGTAMRGTRGHAPEVTALHLGARPATATVRDCVDVSGWQTLDTTTGWRLPPTAGLPARHVATAALERPEGEPWKVSAYTEHRDRPC
ncbi:secreted protein/lipoprotein [Streptomyces sp. NPDC006296]|uniref:secreted protein/lipoprotein n=1 Tax=Streptomyces sp. NPDC006296 TaxID=3156746 RepID=UPI0033BAD79E